MQTLPSSQFGTTCMRRHETVYHKVQRKYYMNDTGACNPPPSCTSLSTSSTIHSNLCVHLLINLQLQTIGMEVWQGVWEVYLMEHQAYIYRKMMGYWGTSSLRRFKNRTDWADFTGTSEGQSHLHNTKYLYYKVVWLWLIWSIKWLDNYSLLLLCQEVDAFHICERERE